MPEESQSVFELREVAVTWQQNPEEARVRGINWSVQSGDYWVIAGRSGSGKSEFIATLAGLQQPGSGELLVFGEQRSALSSHLRDREQVRIGVVFEAGARLFHGLTVAENILLPLQYHENCTTAQAWERLRPLIAEFELEPFASRLPHGIYRHLRPRVLLARALALEPEVLLVDNPISGLDTAQGKWWLDTLDRISSGHALLHRRPITLVVTTDWPEPWRNRAKQFALLRNGTWVLMGPRDKLPPELEL